MRRYIAGVAVLLVVVAVVSYTVVEQDEAGTDTPHVILITLESVRGDRIGPCGPYSRNTTPELCELSEQSIYFSDAIAPGTWTGVSIPSILTGRLPNVVGFQSWESFSKKQVLADGPTTIGEHLYDQGYRTATNTGKFWASDQGLARGYSNKTYSISGRLDRSRPFHLWFHPIQYAHFPYAPEDTYRVWDDVELGHNEIQNLTWETLHRYNISPSDLSDLYDAKIREGDDRIGSFIDRLRQQGAYNDSLIIITSDHGEAFGEHNLTGHAKPPYRHQVHVPLIVKLPQQRLGGSVVDSPVSLLDLHGFIKDVVGSQPYRPRKVDELSLVRQEGEGGMVAAAFPERGWMYRNDRFTYMLSNVNEVCLGDGDPEELMFSTMDEHEEENIAASRPGIADELQSSLCERFRTGAAQKYAVTNGSLSSEHKKRLRDLGYID